MVKYQSFFTRKDFDNINKKKERYYPLFSRQSFPNVTLLTVRE